MGEVLQTDLFGHKAPPKVKRLEVHEHCIISGPRACQSWRNRIVHSHEGGDEPHSHLDMGPASYTIDKDDWARATGMKGGGCKRFTDAPSGEQFPIKELEQWQTEFEVHISYPPPEFKGEGAGIAPIARMMLAAKMNIVSITDHRPKKSA